MDTYIDPYFRLAESAEQHKYLYHYTSIDSFEKIICGGKLKLNRLDQMDDKGENEYLSDFWKNKVYACCFTHSKEGKERFWSEYAKNNGVRIEFPNHLLTQENYRVVSENGYYFPKTDRTIPNHKRYDSDADWGVYNISKVDIHYLTQENRTMWCGKGNGLTQNCLADTSYDWEEETRIRIAMRPIGWEAIRNKTNEFAPMRPFFERIYIELDGILLSNISITIPNQADERFYCMVKKILLKNPLTRNCIVRRLE